MTLAFKFCEQHTGGQCSITVTCATAQILCMQYSADTPVNTGAAAFAVCPPPSALSSAAPSEWRRLAERDVPRKLALRKLLPRGVWLRVSGSFSAFSSFSLPTLALMTLFKLRLWSRVGSTRNDARRAGKREGPPG